MRKPIALCSRCEQLLTDPASLQRLYRDDVSPHGRFSKLEGSCSLCSLVKRPLVDYAAGSRLELDPDVEDGKVALFLMFYDSDSDHESDDGDVSRDFVEEEEASGFQQASPSALVF